MTRRNELIRCPHCGKYCEYGFNVCQGCGAEIVYSATFEEMKGCGCSMAILGFFIMAFTGLSLDDLFGIAFILFIIGFILPSFLYTGVRFIRSYRHK